MKDKRFSRLNRAKGRETGSFSNVVLEPQKKNTGYVKELGTDRHGIRPVPYTDFRRYRYLAGTGTFFWDVLTENFGRFK